MKSSTCCFTGHRPFKLPWAFEEDHPDCVRLKLMLAMEIETMISRGCTNFLTGMCWGTDIWCAEMVLNLRKMLPQKGIRLTAAIPYEQQYTGWTPDYQERYFSVLEQADESVTLRRHYAKGCCLERNRYMIDRSGHMIAVFDGQPGGTANSVDYARRKGLEVVLFDPVKLAREHIPGARDLRLVR